MRTVLSFLLLAMVSASAQAQQVQRIEITEVGIYQAEKTGDTPSPGVAAGTVNTISNITLVQKTTTVPAAVGTHFGFRFKIIGEPGGASVTLKMVDLFPSPGLRNPATGNTNMRDEYTVQKTLGVTSYKGYTFDHDWELVPGKWVFEVWQGDRKLAEQSFTVVKP